MTSHLNLGWSYKKMKAKWRTLNLLFGKWSDLALRPLDNLELDASSFNDIIIWPIFANTW